MKTLRRIFNFKVRMSIYVIIILFSLFYLVFPHGETTGMAFLKEVVGCADSDFGKGYYLKGTVTYQNQEYTDECYWGEYIYEYYCWSDGVEIAWYRCPNGCRNGACV
jgi:hypothetical protein